LAEETLRFDDIPAGYQGNLYALVAPRSFAVVVRPGTSLAQLRLLTTVPGAMVRDQELNLFWSTHPLLYRLRMTSTGPQPISYEKAVLEEGLFLSADFQRPPKAPLAYRPRRVGAVIDLEKTQGYKAEEYWDPVLPDYEPNVIRLLPGEFYLVRCQEKLSIPPSLAAEMLPYDARLGELRSHYAGFFDPGFGCDPGGGLLGTPAVLEIRSQEPFVIRHGHSLCRLQFFRMVEEPDILYGDPRLGSSYQQQRYPFSKHFIPPQPSETHPLTATAQPRLKFPQGD
jgi:dCTP deaminase